MAGGIAATEPSPQSTFSTSQMGTLLAVSLVALFVAGAYYYYNFEVPLNNRNPSQNVANQQHSADDGHNHDTQEQGAQASQFQAPSEEDIREAESALRGDPTSAALNVRMGNILFDSGKYSEAIPYYQKALQVEPNNPDVIVDLGVCYFNLKDFGKAQANFELAYQKDPVHINALYNLGVVAVQNGQVNELIQYWTKLQKVAPESPQARRALEMLNQIHQQVKEFTGEDDKNS